METFEQLHKVHVFRPCAAVSHATKREKKVHMILEFEQDLSETRKAPVHYIQVTQPSLIKRSVGFPNIFSVLSGYQISQRC